MADGNRGPDDHTEWHRYVTRRDCDLSDIGELEKSVLKNDDIARWHPHSKSSFPGTLMPDIDTDGFAWIDGCRKSSFNMLYCRAAIAAEHCH